MYFKVVLTLLIISLLYISQLQYSIAYDEAFTYFTYTDSPIVALLHYTLPNNHQLHSLFVWLSTSLMGNSIIAIRIPAFFSTILMLSMVYQQAKRFYNPNVAVVSILLLAAHPLLLQYGVQSRGYMLSILLLLLLISRINRRNLWGKHNIYIIILLCSALMITLPTMIIAIIGTVLWGMTFHHKTIYKRFVIFPAIVGVCLSVIIFYIYPLTQGWFTRFSRLFGYKNPALLLSDIFAQYVLSSPVAIVIFILLIIGIIPYTKSKRPAQLFFILAISTVLIMSLQYIVSGSLIFPRNLMFLLPIVVFVGGGFLLRVVRYQVLFIAIAFFSVANIYITIQREPTTTDLLLETVEQYTIESDFLILGCCEEYPLWYELIQRHQGYLVDSRKDFNRVIVLPFRASFDELIGKYSLENVVENCEVEDWNQFQPYVCEVNKN